MEFLEKALREQRRRVWRHGPHIAILAGDSAAAQAHLFAELHALLRSTSLTEQVVLVEVPPRENMGTGSPPISLRSDLYAATYEELRKRDRTKDFDRSLIRYHEIEQHRNEEIASGRDNVQGPLEQFARAITHPRDALVVAGENLDRARRRNGEALQSAERYRQFTGLQDSADDAFFEGLRTLSSSLGPLIISIECIDLARSEMKLLDEAVERSGDRIVWLLGTTWSVDEGNFAGSGIAARPHKVLPVERYVPQPRKALDGQVDRPHELTRTSRLLQRSERPSDAHGLYALALAEEHVSDRLLTALWGLSDLDQVLHRLRALSAEYDFVLATRPWMTPRARHELRSDLEAEESRRSRVAASTTRAADMLEENLKEISAPGFEQQIGDPAWVADVEELLWFRLWSGDHARALPLLGSLLPVLWWSRRPRRARELLHWAAMALDGRLDDQRVQRLTRWYELAWTIASYADGRPPTSTWRPSELTSLGLDQRSRSRGLFATDVPDGVVLLAVRCAHPGLLGSDTENRDDADDALLQLAGVRFPGLVSTLEAASSRHPPRRRAQVLGSRRATRR